MNYDEKVRLSVDMAKFLMSSECERPIGLAINSAWTVNTEKAFSKMLNDIYTCIDQLGNDTDDSTSD